jgi:excisionase family DNA binding protein
MSCGALEISLARSWTRRYLRPGKPGKNRKDTRSNRFRTGKKAQANIQVTPLGEQGRYMESKEVMTLREASEYLGISPDTLYKYLGERQIPAFKLGNRWRFKKDLLDRWMEKKSERPLDGNPKRLAKTMKG